MSPIERFKDSYENWRYNVFTGADMAVDKEEDNLTIPSGSPFVIQLLELPRKNTPTSITVYCYDDTTYFTEVVTAPNQGEFRVDYPPEDGEGTGLVEFNQNDASKEVRINYKATGSPILKEFLDTKVSFPSGNPSDHQILGFVSGAPEWRYNPIRYFHEGPVIYHSSGESESCLLFRFKKSAKEGTVILELKGAKLHQGYYTELKEHSHAMGSHTHAAGTLAGSQSTHSHGAGTLVADSNGAHSHAKGTLAGSQPTHTHKYDAGDNYIDTEPAGNDPVSISGNTSSTGAHTHSISGSTAAGGGVAVTISGNTAAGGAGNTENAGGSPKTYPNQLKVYINGVDKTTNILALTALSQFGNGTAGHAFVTNGSGEMDISSLVSANQIHEIKITEPISAAGGRCLLHLELY
jgi:hypothetical protein